MINMGHLPKTEYKRSVVVAVVRACPRAGGA